MRKVLIIAAAATVVATAANANWVYEGSESAFDDNGIHMAFTGTTLYGLGFRCSGSNVEAMYTTPDTSFDSDGYKRANMMQPKLKMRVDDAPVINLEATLLDLNGSIAALTDVTPEILANVRDAKKRVAVVLSLANENYHEQSFSVRGSTRAIEQLLQGCSIVIAE